MGWFSKHKGQQSENLVAKWLQSQHVVILQQNFHCKGGEIDIIGLDASNTILFIEVKARKNSDFGHPSEFVSKAKQHRIIKCAQVFLQKHPQYQNHAMRFDVISALEEMPEPEWLQNAFSAF